MRTTIFCGLLAFSFVLVSARAADETCAECERLVQATGDFTHVKTTGNAPISDSPAGGYDGFNGGDRTRIELPEVQTDLLRCMPPASR